MWSTGDFGLNTEEIFQMGQIKDENSDYDTAVRWAP